MEINATRIESVRKRTMKLKEEQNNMMKNRKEKKKNMQMTGAMKRKA